MDCLFDSTAAVAALNNPVVGNLRKRDVTLAALQFGRGKGPEGRAQHIVQSLAANRETVDDGRPGPFEPPPARQAVQRPSNAELDHMTVATQSIPPLPGHIALGMPHGYVPAHDH